MSGWQYIVNAPKTGERVLCWAPGWEPHFLVWKTNSRLVRWHAEGKMLEYSTEYFGIEGELDDYEYALPGGGPKVWYDLPIPEWKEDDDAVSTTQR